MLGNDRQVSRWLSRQRPFLGVNVKAARAMERLIYEKIMCLGVSVGLGVVDPNSGTGNGWLDRRQRISKSGKMYGQYEREAGSISSV